jgi:membrane protein YdbS with pleckstrin-like domain
LATADPVKPTAAKSSKGKSRQQSPNAGLRRLADRTPNWIFPVLTFLELVGIVTYLSQIPLTLAMVRLDYELRWYIVTDRSLRIRAGLTSVQETTMSFANVQQVVVTQGPLQRLLGIADVRVQSAGGGGDHHEPHAGESLHTGVFHGVDNAQEIRDLILDRLRQFRETGLGDPDEPARSATGIGLAAGRTTPAADSAFAAAEELLTEARALRRALS